MASVVSYQVVLAYAVSSTVDITTDVQEITLSRSIATNLYPWAVGLGTIKLNNDHNRYTPTNSYTDLRIYPGLAVQITGVASGVSATRLFTGTVDDMSTDVKLGNRFALYNLSDNSKSFVDDDISIEPLGRNVNVDAGFTAILAAAGLTAAQQSVGTIASTASYIFFDQVKASDAIDKLAQSGGYFAWMARDGTAMVRNQNHISSLTSVMTLSEFYALDYQWTDENIVNRVKVKSVQPEAASNITSVAWISSHTENAIPIASGETAVVELNYRDNPWVVVSCSITGRHADTSPGGSGTDKTSQCSFVHAEYGKSSVASIYNSDAGTVYLTQYIVRGYIVDKDSTIRNRYYDPTSQSSYGIHKMTIENDYVQTNIRARAVASAMLTRYKTLWPVIKPTVRNEFPKILTADIADGISIINKEIMSVDAQWMIVGKSERITASNEGWIHEAQYELLRTP